MIKNNLVLALIISATSVLPVSSARSAVVPVANPSFEINPQISGVPDSWSTYNAGSATFSVGTFPPTTVDDFYNPPGPGGVPVAPDGDHVAWAYIDSGYGAGVVGFQQTLSSNLMANSIYELDVAVGNLQTATSPRTGNSLNYEGFPGYIIQLLAGDTVIAEDINSISIAEGDFGIASLSISIGQSHPLLGQALGIRLLNQNTDLSGQFGIDWNSEVDFDAVQLSVSPIPVPAAVWLFGTALIGLIGFGKKRKAA